jgi:hypothetical protein
MKNYMILLSAMCFVGLLACIHYYPGKADCKKELPEVKPGIYITRTDRVRTFEGGEVWILEYTVDGVFQAPVFDSPEALSEYREYLDTIGRVYRKEGDNGQK